MSQSVKISGRSMTIGLTDGHEFDFEIRETDGVKTLRLFGERWKNRRLPLNASVSRQIAQVVAEAQFRRRGLL